jgi:hypothetical protein
MSYAGIFDVFDVLSHEKEDEKEGGIDNVQYDSESWAGNPFDSMDNGDEHRSDALKAKLVILNRTTASSAELEVAVGQKKSFEDVEVHIKACKKHNFKYYSDDEIDLRLFITNSDNRDDISDHSIFSDNVSYNAIQHKVYSIIPISCS